MSLRINAIDKIRKPKQKSNFCRFKKYPIKIATNRIPSIIEKLYSFFIT